MLNTHTKSVPHFGKFVPCCEGHVISHSYDSASLVRVSSAQEAERISDQYLNALYSGSKLDSYIAGDAYMLNQHPLTPQSSTYNFS